VRKHPFFDLKTLYIERIFECKIFHFLKLTHSLTHPRMPVSSPNFFARRPNTKLRVGPVLGFIAAATVAWLINVFGQLAFPSPKIVPYAAHTTITAIVVMLLIMVSVRLLKYFSLPPQSLGLKFTDFSPMHLLFGLLAGAMAVCLLAGLLYLLVPYHFAIGPLSLIGFLKETYSYFLGNFLEELMFRGFLLVVLSQLIGWQKAVIVLAILFGLFHLCGFGVNSTSFTIVLTTAAYSFIFSYAFILTRSMWASVSAHVIANLLLHAVFGLDEAAHSIFTPVFESKWPVYDVATPIYILSAFLVSSILYVMIRRAQRER
jgi:membrane protease YdiL (CAAX protease family)